MLTDWVDILVRPGIHLNTKPPPTEEVIDLLYQAIQIITEEGTADQGKGNGK